jgi:regulator of replication initiation timing
MICIYILCRAVEENRDLREENNALREENENLKEQLSVNKETIEKRRKLLRSTKPFSDKPLPNMLGENYYTGYRTLNMLGIDGTCCCSFGL